MSPNTEAIGDLLSRPHVRTPGEAPGFWELYLDTGGSRSRANQQGVRFIHTRDRGFRRFEGIEVRDALS